MKSQEFSRRNFIKTSALFAVAVSMPDLSSCKSETTDFSPNDCLTTDDILGPYYKAGAPLRENIIPVTVDTDPLIIKGKVFSHCAVALAKADVEIWNADENGAYDTSELYLFRGKYATLADGLYRFKTIIPGRYLNGSVYRPSHIHLRITAPGHQELVSQIYFKEDPFISTDPWASATKARERILTIEKNEDNVDTITFDIHLTEV
jgi:protocatechuate 3,4-dioxygenase beta subunit